jgi:putative addiction module component (TIGR02574 family)
MDLSLEELSKQVMRLPRESRALLADRIAESLSSAELDELQPLWVLEATRRVEEIDSGKVKAIPGDEVLAEIRQIVGE